jgi:hypothetical protein
MVPTRMDMACWSSSLSPVKWDQLLVMALLYWSSSLSPVKWDQLLVTACGYGGPLLLNFGLRAGDLNFRLVVRSPAQAEGFICLPQAFGYVLWQFAFHLVVNANAMEVKSCMKQADVSAALEQSLLTVFDSPLSAIVDISVTSIMRSSVVESDREATF